jgi:hypothetical protein
MFRRQVFFLAATSALMITGCSEDTKLSRTQATDILRKSIYFEDGSIAATQTGDVYEKFYTLAQLHNALYFVLLESELIAFTPSQKPGFLVGIPLKGYELKLTAEGKQQAKSEKWNHIAVGNHWEVPLAHIEFIGVTGIRQDSDTKAVVEYSYKWNPTEIGKRLKESLKDPKMGDSTNFLMYYRYTLDWNDELPGTLTFSRFDDGWRIGS